MATVHHSSKYDDQNATYPGIYESSIDHESLKNLRALQREGEPDLLHDLINMFLTDAQPRLLSLKQAVIQKDAPTVEREAHALKGSCSNFGARPMSAICQSLQAIACRSDLGQAPDLLAHLTAEFERVRIALTTALLKESYADSHC